MVKELIKITEKHINIKAIFEEAQRKLAKVKSISYGKYSYFWLGDIMFRFCKTSDGRTIISVSFDDEGGLIHNKFRRITRADYEKILKQILKSLCQKEKCQKSQ